MPTKVRRLKEQAIEYCKRRGHFMNRFQRLIPYRATEPRYYITNCIYCDMYVQVIPKPYPNEIDIGGTAVALDCVGKHA